MIHRAQLEQIAAEAYRLESISPPAAATAWRQCLDLLPPDSPQHAQISQRMGLLAAGLGGGFAAGSAYGHPGGHEYRPAAQAPRNDTWATALAKTGGSMLLSIAAYWLVFGDPYLSLGFVVLILVHELGHSWAMRHYKLSASPPIFIPFLGALINLRQRPPNAWVEAVVGIAGPVAGTAGALACFAAAWALPAGSRGQEMLLFLAAVGFFLNLFNLLPVPPMDGGRVTAAVSPWIWMLGVAALAGWIVLDVLHDGRPSFVMLLILFFALPRVRETLRARGRDTPYYAIGRRARWVMGATYLALLLTLGGLFYYCNYVLGAGLRI